MNKIILIGNLTKEVELRYAPSGAAIATTGIATNRKWKDQSGQQKEEVCFIDLTFFGKSAEVANQYLHKGGKVAIDGRLKLDQWQDQNGNNRSKHSIIVENMELLGVKIKQEQYKQQREEAKPPAQGEHNVHSIDAEDDEIPF